MGNYVAPEKVREANELRRLGFSIRDISKKTGLHRETVCAYVGEPTIDYRLSTIESDPKTNKSKASPRAKVTRRKGRFKPIGSESIIDYRLSTIESEPKANESKASPRANRPSVPGCYKFDKRTKLTADEEAELWVEWKKNGDVSARDLIVRCNLRYVERIAKMMRRGNCSLDVLIAEGNYGLMRALDKFEPERGLRFVTYASYWIKNYISKYIESSRTVVGKELVHSKDVYKLRRALVQARNSVGDNKEAIVEIVSKKMRLPIKKVRDLIGRLNCHDVSLDNKVYTDSPETFVDTIASDKMTPEEHCVKIEQAVCDFDTVASALSVLNEREKFIVKQRLMNDEPPTLAELGRQLGVSRERARQLESRAIRKLKGRLSV